jgi:hypothetical protein
VIPHSHFTRIADKQDVDAKTVERDYVLTHVLTAIGRQPGNHRMVLKGGTALRLCYFEDYRYSADLDFSLQDDTDPQAALELVQAALGELAQRGSGFPTSPSPRTAGTSSTSDRWASSVISNSMSRPTSSSRRRPLCPCSPDTQISPRSRSRYTRSTRRARPIALRPGMSRAPSA